MAYSSDKERFRAIQGRVDGELKHHRLREIALGRVGMVSRKISAEHHTHLARELEHNTQQAISEKIKKELAPYWASDEANFTSTASKGAMRKRILRFGFSFALVFAALGLKLASCVEGLNTADRVINHSESGETK